MDAVASRARRPNPQGVGVHNPLWLYPGYRPRGWGEAAQTLRGG
jgi:hypothetical protein